MEKIYKSIIIVFAILFSVPGWNQSSVRKKISMDDDWKFHFGHAADAAKDFNYSIATIFSKSGGAARTAIDPKFKDSAWRNLSLPHDWAVELPFTNVQNFDVMSHGYKPVGGLFPETSIGWYRKNFKIASQDSGQRFQIQFDGIFRDAQVWVNGFYLGKNESGYVGVAYDISDFIHFDRENVLVVRADATQYEGWFYEGAGIYRHVWLNKYNNLHIATDGIFFYSTVANNKAAVTVETTIDNDNLANADAQVVAYLLDRNGKVVAKAADKLLSFQNGESKSALQTIT